MKTKALTRLSILLGSAALLAGCQTTPNHANSGAAGGEFQTEGYSSTVTMPDNNGGFAWTPIPVIHAGPNGSAGPGNPLALGTGLGMTR
jgi:hypothetical protein